MKTTHPVKLTAIITILVLSSISPAAAAPSQTSAPLEMLLSLDPHPGAPRNSEGDIIRLQNNKLALVYTKFYGGDDDHSAARLALRTSPDEGKTWSADSVLLDNEGGQNVMSVSLRPSADGGILLFYLRKDAPGTSCTMYMRRATANLDNLSTPVMVTTLPGYHVVNNDRILRLKSGRLLVPSALHTDPDKTDHPQGKFVENAAMICYHSDDDGRTWHKDHMPVTPMAQRKIVLQEPGLVELTDGRILMYIRTNQGYQYQSFSSDAGETWSTPEPMPLASPISPATIERLPGENAPLIAIWNDHSGRWPYKKGKRTPLTIALSRDEGKTWSPSHILEDDPGGWFCYTSITYDDENILLSYCAGQEYEGGLNRLKLSKLPLSWVTELK